MLEFLADRQKGKPSGLADQLWKKGKAELSDLKDWQTHIQIKK